jgi:hypothetical protein
VSHSSRLQAVLGRILTPAEMVNLRQAIHVGARGVVTGRYDIKAVERSAERICRLIEGAHLDEARSVERQHGKPFVELCRELVVNAVIEEVSIVGGWAALLEREAGGGRAEERGGVTGGTVPEIF